MRTARALGLPLVSGIGILALLGNRVGTDQDTPRPAGEFSVQTFRRPQERRTSLASKACAWKDSGDFGRGIRQLREESVRRH